MRVYARKIPKEKGDEKRPVSTEPSSPCPSFLTGVVGQSQPSVGREGSNRVRWPVRGKSMSTKPVFTYVRQSPVPRKTA